MRARTVRGEVAKDEGSTTIEACELKWTVCGRETSVVVDNGCGEEGKMVEVEGWTMRAWD